MHPSLRSMAVWAFVCAPVVSQADPSARLEIGPTNGGLNASTYGARSFVVENLASGDAIVRLRLDLSTSLIRDFVFDPFGTGGDVVSKPFSPDQNGGLVGVGSPSYLVPNGGGFDVLEVPFSGFDPGELFAFSIDVDPTTIQGSQAPGPSDSGSVSGLELTGATVEIEYASGTILTGRTMRVAGSQSASRVILVPGPEVAPTLELVGLASPSKAFVDQFTARMTGTPGRSVRLLQLEGALFVAGLPNGGFDVDEFEANSVVAVSESTGTFDSNGVLELTVMLGETVPEGGITHFVAVQSDGQGDWSQLSNDILADYDDVNVAFQSVPVTGVSVNNPTTLQFGPDSRLYVGEQFGLIKVLTLTETPGQYDVTATETIDLIQQLPNHNDDGTLNTNLTTRQVTGLLVTGTAQAPVIYVTSSDPRIGGGGSGQDKNLDTNSGILSRLDLGPGGWQRTDLIRGLPRSEENHAPNGMQLSPDGQTMYMAVGGNTNMGARSNNFALLPEFALSAAILEIDLAAIGNQTHDLPTLDDEDRPGATDANDPFGGNNGKNQARLVPGGPVQIYSPGWRNIYDLVVTESGRMFGVDNGPNSGWGDVPVLAMGVATNQVNEPGVTHPDNLHFIPGPGYYAGHPNPTRASRSNTFNASNPQSPVSVDNPIESDYLEPGVDDGALVTWGSSTNGMCEYRADNFGGAMRGDLLLISLNSQLTRVKPTANGAGTLLVNKNFASAGAGALDVTSQGMGEIFEGTIWIVNRVADSLTVLKPLDATGCTGIASNSLDEDFDGFTNQDEIDNGTDPCSAASAPPDHDGDFISDLNDPDDDDDGIPDTSDPFAIDAANGRSTALPIRFLWENNQGPLGGLLDIGFTGLMTDGSTDYAGRFDPANMTVFGAAGAVTVDAAPDGTALGPVNDQSYAFQVGIPMDHGTPNLLLSTRVLAPFAGLTPDPEQAVGLFLGTGTQSDFCRLVVTGSGIEFQREVGDVLTGRRLAPLALPGPGYIDLILEVNPFTGAVRPFYELDDGQGPQQLGGYQALPRSWFSGPSALAIGILSTSGSATPFPATWDRFECRYQNDLDVVARINCGGPSITPAGGGAIWGDDAAFLTTSANAYTNSGATLSVDPTVPTDVPIEVFASERWLPSSQSSMDWVIPVSTNERYQVRLYFADIYSGTQAPGARVFDVELEGQLVLDDFDVSGTVGGYTGTMRAFEVTPQDSAIDIRLTSVVQNAKISAIEVLALNSLASNPGSARPYGLAAGGVNQGVLDMVPPPTIGATSDLQLSAMGSGANSITMLSFAASYLPFFDATVLIDFSLPVGELPLPLVGGQASVPITIPMDPAAIGTVLYLQAFAPDPGFGLLSLRLSHGLEITIGD